MEQQNVKNMSKRNYKITQINDEWWNAQCTDSYGKDHQNWFETKKEANSWVVYMWENEKEPLTKDQEMDMLANAIWGCTKLDKELSLLKSNEDNLD
tara:strand:- start:45 stop:332 length:288 start_codon:yes stop_codon:yes gene_type:complete